VGLGALTVEQLDHLAETRSIDEYPSRGAKPDKLAVLEAAGLSLDALTVEHLDRLAAANELDDYPASATKREKVAALEAAAISVTEAK
jgi:hypothetical protein